MVEYSDERERLSVVRSVVEYWVVECVEECKWWSIVSVGWWSVASSGCGGVW